jgi:Spy/CpxP family protein refolding chaperone
MKNDTIRRITLLGALALAVPIAALAQADSAGPRDGARAERVAAHQGHHGKHHRHAHSHHRGMHGGMHGGAHGAGALRGLDLSEEQRDQLFALRHAQAPKMRELGKTLRESNRELRTLAMSEAYDEARARQLAETASKAGADIALLRAQLGNETFRILTPEQRAKLAERAERGERRMKGPRRDSDDMRS